MPQKRNRRSAVEDRWTKTGFESSTGGRGTYSSDPESKLSGCLIASDTEGLAQNEFDAFVKSVAVYDINVALESRLFAIRKSAEVDLVSAKSTETDLTKLASRRPKKGGPL